MGFRDYATSRGAPSRPARSSSQGPFPRPIRNEQSRAVGAHRPKPPTNWRPRCKVKAQQSRHIESTRFTCIDIHEHRKGQVGSAVIDCAQALSELACFTSVCSKAAKSVLCGYLLLFQPSNINRDIPDPVREHMSIQRTNEPLAITLNSKSSCFVVSVVPLSIQSMDPEGTRRYLVGVCILSSLVFLSLLASSRQCSAYSRSVTELVSDDSCIQLLVPLSLC